MNKNIIDLLMVGKLDEAKTILVKKGVVPDEVENWVYDSSNITLYTLVASMLINEEFSGEHQWASYLMAMPLCAYNGAYSLGLFHARRALELDPSNVEHKRFLILFHDIPENLIKKDEAIKIAKEVLQEDPDCGVSKEVLKRYGILKEDEPCK